MSARGAYLLRTPFLKALFSSILRAGPADAEPAFHGSGADSTDSRAVQSSQTMAARVRACHPPCLPSLSAAGDVALRTCVSLASHSSAEAEV